MPHAPGIGAIFGIVSENGVAKASGRVGLYDRTTMQLVNKTLTDPLGGYQFTGLNQITNDYLVLALDDDGTPAKNALVQDYIQPIPAHMGATAVQNWELRTRRKDPCYLWVPRFQGTYIETMGGGGYPQTRSGMQAAYLANQPTITPGAPQFPSLKLNTGAAYFAPFHMASGWQTTGTDTFSLEFVFDSTFDSQVTLRGYQTTNGGAGFMHMLGVSWTVSSKTFRVSASNAIGTNNNFHDLSIAGMWNTGTFVYSALAPGVHHVVATFTLASAMRLYVDGALVATISIAGTNALFCPPGYFGIMFDGMLSIGAVGGTQGAAANGLGVFGPIAAYHTALSATDVLNSYNDLMIGTTPASTGYVREILTDDPALIYRLDEGSYGTSKEYLTNLASATHYGAITFSGPSPVVGGSMMHFGGGGMKALRGSGAGSNQQRSWEFWINPDTATPPAYRALFAGRYQADGPNWWKIGVVQSTGVLRMDVITGTGPATETFVFLYTPPAGVATHIVIVLDKIGLTCKLYVNGVYREQVTTTGAFMSEGNISGQNDITPYYNTTIVIGATVSNAISITEGFLGYLSDFALYYKALAPDRIQAHYDSRLLI